MCEHKYLNVLLSVVTALSMSACVFPIQLADDEPYGEQFIGFIELGDTPRSEIESQLGTPYLVFSDGRWWLYQANRQMTKWGWLFCVQTGCDGGEFAGKVRLYSLVLEFNEKDAVNKTLVITEQHPCNRDQTLCYRDGVLSVIEEGNALTQVFPGNTPNTPVTFVDHDVEPDNKVSRRFMVTADDGFQQELIERNGLIYEAGATDPYAGHITLSDVHGVKEWERTYEGGMLNGAETFWYTTGEKSYRAYYVDNVRHGPMTSWKRDGSISFQMCFERGMLVDLNMDECQP